jgi:hypothetical protein
VGVVVVECGSTLGVLHDHRRGQGASGRERKPVQSKVASALTMLASTDVDDAAIVLAKKSARASLMLAPLSRSDGRHSMSDHVWPVDGTKDQHITT